jgi:hypothetical protein
MLFSELDLAGMLTTDDDALGPETARGEIPEALLWSVFCDVLERIEPRGAQPGAAVAADGREGT